MKNTRDPFDDELRNRLDNYSEEPDDKLWSGIASNIETVKPPFAWGKWLSFSSAVVVITAGVLYFSLNTTINKELTQAASASLAEKAASEMKSEDTLSLQDRASIDEQAAASEQATTATDVLSDNKAIEEINERSTSSIQETQPESNQRTEHDRALVASQTIATKSLDTTDSARKTSIATITPTTSLNIEPGESGSNTPPDRSADADRSERLFVTSAQPSSNANGQHSKIEPTTSPSASESAVTSGTKENNTSTSSSRASANQGTVTAQAEKPQQLKAQAASANENQGDASNISPTTSAEVLKDSINNNAGDKPVIKAVASKEEVTNEKQKSDRKLSLYFTAMPTLGYQRIEANQNDNVFVESVSKVSNFSAKRLGIRAEIGVEYALTQKFRMFGGILYYQRKQTIDYVERVPVNDVIENPVDTVVVIQPEFTSQARTFEYELRNLGVQLGVNYVLKEKKFLHTIGTGIEFHKALNKLPAEQQRLGFHSNPSTFVFANVYYRLQYPAQGRLRAVFQPTFNYSLYLNQDMNAPFFVKPYGLGLNVGLTYHF
jgi:hypothetical protein